MPLRAWLMCQCQAPLLDCCVLVVPTVQCSSGAFEALCKLV